VACRDCALGYLVTLSEEPDSTCPGCGRPPRRRETQLLIRCRELFLVRKPRPSERRRWARPSDPRLFSGRLNLAEMEPAADVLSLVPLSLARAYRVVPVRRVRDRVLIAAVDPGRPGLLDDLEMILGVKVLGAQVNSAVLEQALRRWYGEAPSNYQELIKRMAGTKTDPVKQLDGLLVDAMRSDADEIIFRAADQSMVIYCVVSNSTRTLRTVGPGTGRSLLRQLKILFGLPPQSRRAREGAADYIGPEGPVRLRGHTSRTDFGENFRIFLPKTAG
jgi:type II secretory ATPase GspE/PulE/Tfp pilus assembly ATPase PilB-like protein